MKRNKKSGKLQQTQKMAGLYFHPKNASFKALRNRNDFKVRFIINQIVQKKLLYKLSRN